MKLKKRNRALLIALAVLLVLTAAGALYFSDYYRADGRALAALKSDGTVHVTQTDYDWFFDGPSEENVLIFYPGGKVEETAYAPLLHELAVRGMDACLVRMPLRLAVFGQDRADLALGEHEAENVYIGGHSLGGAVAALYAAEHADALRGLVLLAAYPSGPLDGKLQVLTVVGTEDLVVRRGRLEAAARYLPESADFCEIDGVNHAQFGSYGPQQGDGEARISPEEQWAETAALIGEVFGG